MSAGRRWRAAVGATALVALSSLTVAPRHVEAALDTLDLVDESFNIEAEEAFTLTVAMPDSWTGPTLDTSVELTAFRPVTNRDEVQAATLGDLPSSIDTVELTADRLSFPAAGQIHVEVPTEVTTKTRDALQLSRPGVYPVQITVLAGGEPLADLVTFLHRVPSTEEGEELPLSLAMAITTDAAVTMDDQGRTVVGATAARSLTALADTLEASRIPVSVRIPPSLLSDLADQSDDGAALVRRLAGLLEQHQLLSSPILPIDPSAAAGAGQQALYTQWLRDGEDSLERSVAAPASRSIVLLDHDVSQAGGALLRNLGARLLVIPPERYDQLPNTVGTFTDTTQLVQLQVSPGVTVDASVVDRELTRALTRVTTTPKLSAIYAVSSLLALRQMIEDSGGNPSRHGVTLGTPDLGLPDPSGFGDLTELLASTPGLRPMTLDELSVRTDELLSPEGPVVVDLPTNVQGDLSFRTQRATSLGLQAASTGSMLPSDDPRIAEWARLVSVLPTSALTDAQVAAIGTRMEDEFATIRALVVVPDGFSVNLTGRTGTVRVNLRNDAQIPLTVRVRMSSPKLITKGDQTVTLPPESFTQVPIEIEARSNGDFAATLEVFTPFGDSRLAPPVPLTASINALAGIGNLVTGAALLVLLTWWVRHLRRVRRGRHAAEAAHRHPATTVGDGGEGSGPDDGPDDGGLSPDAATSTLPPS